MNHSGICDPFVWLNSYCPSSWNQPVIVLYSSLLVYIMVCWALICSKQIKRFFSGGFRIQFGIFGLLPFVLAGAVKIVFFIFHLHAMGTDIFSTAFMIWYSNFSIRLCIYGTILLACFWAEAYRSYVSKEIKKQVSYVPMAIITTLSFIILEGIAIGYSIYPKGYFTTDILFTIHLVEWILEAVVLSACTGTLCFFNYHATVTTPLHKKMKRLAVFFFIGILVFSISNILKMVFWKEVISSTSFALWFFIVSLNTVAEGIFILTAATFLRGGEILPKGIAFKYRPKLKIGITIMNDGSKKLDTKSTGGDKPCKTDVWSEEDFKLAKELPFWRNPPKSCRDLFTFPSAIDQTDAKIKATMISLEIILFLAIDYFTGFAYIYIYIVVSSLSRCLFGPRFNLESWINLLLIRECITLPTHLVPSPPKRFAQFISFIFGMAYVILRIPFNLTVAANWIAAIHLTFALLEACFFSLCGLCRLSIRDDPGISP